MYFSFFLFVSSDERTIEESNPEAKTERMRKKECVSLCVRQCTEDEHGNYYERRRKTRRRRTRTRTKFTLKEKDGVKGLTGIPV